MNRFALVCIEKTGVIKNNFQAFKTLWRPVLASLKTEKGNKSPLFETVTNLIKWTVLHASVISDNSHVHR